MNDHRDEFDSEPVWQPMIRIEATFHPAPGFEYLEHVPLGETEAVPMEPMISVEAELKPVRQQAASRVDSVEFVEFVFRRPRMVCADIENLHDLLVFVQGVYWGQKPPGASDWLCDFSAYVNQRFQQPPAAAWTTTLLNQFGNQPFGDACGAVEQILREWKASRR